jgi:hypothetical protein
VGGLAGLCLLGLAIAFLILRYRQQVRVVPPAVADGQSPTLKTIPTMAELSPLSVRGELAVEHRVELDGTHQEELDGKLNTIPTMTRVTTITHEGRAGGGI